MSERVRIYHFEAEDVTRLLGDYRDRRERNMHSHPRTDAEDLVNAIGEIYEKALARKGPVTPR